jgi:hypothetical protein
MVAEYENGLCGEGGMRKTEQGMRMRMTTVRGGGMERQNME